ncbi:MAG: DUF3179 domain-containing (seleno)protein [Gammaproteobacteria bacterium]|nr:DUF3179 domain-containing (seleno)protein [Gammaproteobacteria bacterium]
MFKKAMILSTALSVLCYLAPAFAQVAEQGPDMPEPTEERVQQILTDLREDSLMRFQPEYAPEYIAANLAAHIADEDRIFGVEVNGVAKAYPREYVAWHHIVQDDFGGTPVLASWCALCGSGAAYINHLKDANGAPRHFEMVGSSGNNVQFGFRDSGDSMQQAMGEFFQGPLKGVKLERAYTLHATWGEWKEKFPDSELMLPESGRQEAYDHYKPMVPVAFNRFRGALTEDKRRPTHDLVVGLDIGGGYKAYPLAELEKQTLVNDKVGSAPVLMTYVPDTDTAMAFLRIVDCKVLSFNEGVMGKIMDAQTSSTWNVMGEAVAGPMKGTKLDLLPPLPSFWFSWAQFYPETEVFTAAH